MTQVERTNSTAASRDVEGLVAKAKATESNLASTKISIESVIEHLDKARLINLGDHHFRRDIDELIRAAWNLKYGLYQFALGKEGVR